MYPFLPYCIFSLAFVPMNFLLFDFTMSFFTGYKACRNGSYRFSSRAVAEEWTFHVRSSWKILKLRPLCYLWTMHNVCICFINSWYVPLVILLNIDSGHIVYVTLLWSIYWLIYSSGIKEVYYGCANEKFGGCGSILSLHLSNTMSLNGYASAASSIYLLHFVIFGYQLYCFFLSASYFVFGANFPFLLKYFICLSQICRYLILRYLNLPFMFFCYLPLHSFFFFFSFGRRGCTSSWRENHIMHVETVFYSQKSSSFLN